MSEHKNPESPIEILPEHLSEEAMAGIVENFILERAQTTVWSRFHMKKKPNRYASNVRGDQDRL